MKAVRIHTYSSDPKQLLYEDAPMRITLTVVTMI
jgi:hypothetical protein